MATLALAAAGAAVGSAVLPAGVSVLGATISGAAIGSQIGSLAGSYIDQALFGASGESRTVEGPRLRDLHVTASSEGAAIPRLYGRARLGGQVIWATDFEEQAITTTQSSSQGGKGGLGGAGGGGSAQSVSRVEYRYFANFAVALAEGPISGVGRIWADGTEIDLSGLTYRIHDGRKDQEPDALIVSREGADRAPGFRGTAYIVFERMALAEFGNRIPQLSFEVFRVRESVADKVRGAVLIPGSGEFVYADQAVVQDLGGGEQRAENVNNRQGTSDWSVAVDQMQQSLPGLENVSLIVSWFGTDLRAGVCEIRPGVDIAEKSTNPRDWRGGGVDRSAAHLVSQRDGRAAYGGTPADWSVVAAISDLKARGVAVTLTPFVLMDVPDGNALPDPYGSVEQPVYPWRGRITCDPAPGVAGSPDKTAAAAAQIAAFAGTAEASDFSISGDEVSYTGPAEWSYRRMVLHQAHLAKAAGGVDTFLLGTELRGLTWVRSAQDVYPFVDVLRQLADDVKAVLGPQTKVTYAADWSEYFGHQPADGTGDVYFHLDPLWASPSIDAVGIDCYWPLSDWRDGRGHLDFGGEVQSIYDFDYLKSNVRGGEFYDWYYASEADREAQVRTPITDGSGKPWVFRAKDIGGWWENSHYDRPGGIEAAVPTGWVPRSKPFWLLEFGCPAVDKGANQPNVFVDPKSSETALPYYSNGTRDDFMQRRYLQALIAAFDPAAEGFEETDNPVSPVYGGRMVDPARLYAYCWDARPYPAFPYNTAVWGDGGNWTLGHWISGRFSHLSLGETVGAVCDDYGFGDFAVDGLSGVVPGYVVDRVMSARDALQPLGLAFFFDAVESGGGISFRHRGGAAPVARVTEGELFEEKVGTPLLTLTRGQETELPASAKLSYISSLNDYQQAVSEARRLAGASGRTSQAELPIVLDAEQAGQMAESWLFEAWSARERASMSLPPSLLGVEPGDVIEVESDTQTKLFRVTDISDRGARELEARGVDPEVYGRPRVAGREARVARGVQVGTPQVAFLDLPLLRGDEPAEAGYVAASLSPWPGGVGFMPRRKHPGMHCARLRRLQLRWGSLSLTCRLARRVGWITRRISGFTFLVAR